MIKLNLGSGDTRIQDHISVDLHTAADVKHDLTTPLPYDDGSVDEIYSSHVIEHFTRKEWDFVRQDWARVLKRGGIMTLRCPDILKLCQLFAADQHPIRIEQIYGQQGSEGQLHKNGFTASILQQSFPDFEMRVMPPGSDYELHVRLIKL
jgi:predicted SAM-dependent methyltransferase